MSAPVALRLPALFGALCLALPVAAMQAHAPGHGTHDRADPAGDADHAGHGQHAGHAATDHAHDQPAGAGESAHAHGAVQPDGQAPRTPIPPLTDADRAAAVPPAQGHAAHGESLHGLLLLNRLETWDDDGSAGLAWEAQGWMGTDLDRGWLRSEGERSGGALRAAHVELLYGRSVARWWDVVAGLRHEARPRQARNFLALGLQGLAPQWFHLGLTGYVGEGGRTAARFDAEHELLFTGRLALQSLFEVDLYGKDDAARGLAAGFASVEAGLRLRYEFHRRFAPYVGISHERALGDTAGLRRAAGESARETRVVAGLRTWF